MSLVFISYSRKDAELVLELANELKQHHVPIWLDQFDILLGQRWDVAIETALKACTHVLAVLSPTAISSQNVLDEISYAIDEKKTLIPIELADCDIPFRLRRFQRKRFQENYVAAFDMLLKELPHGAEAGELAAGRREVEVHAALVINRQITPAVTGIETGTMPALAIQAGSRKAYVPIMHPPVIIGRGSDCDIIVRVASVSRHHVKITREGDHYLVEDLGSRNGTSLNGFGLTPAYPLLLQPGYTIGIGEVRLQFDPERSPSLPLDVLDNDDDVETVSLVDPRQFDDEIITLATPLAVTQPIPIAKSIELISDEEIVIVMGLTLEPGLTTAQFRFLQLLVQAKGAVCTRDEIAEYVWPQTANDRVSNIVIDIVAHTVRDRLAEIDRGWTYVIAEGDHCYRFNDRLMKT